MLIKFEGFRQAEKQEIIFVVFYTNATKFSREWWLSFTDKYMENEHFYLRLSSRDFISQIWSVNSFNWCLYFVIHRKCRMSTFLELLSIKTPDFLHTFTVNFALALVVLHPLQYGVVNLQKVYLVIIVSSVYNTALMWEILLELLYPRVLIKFEVGMLI